MMVEGLWSGGWAVVGRCTPPPPTPAPAPAPLSLQLTQADVPNLGRPVPGQQDVGRLQVQVDDAAGVQEVQPARNVQGRPPVQARARDGLAARPDPPPPGEAAPVRFRVRRDGGVQVARHQLRDDDRVARLNGGAHKRHDVAVVAGAEEEDLPRQLLHERHAPGGRRAPLRFQGGMGGGLQGRQAARALARALPPAGRR